MCVCVGGHRKLNLGGVFESEAVNRGLSVTSRASQERRPPPVQTEV